MKYKKDKTYIYVMVCIAIFLLVISFSFSLVNMFNSNIILGVYLDEINLSNLNKTEATKILTDYEANFKKEIVLKYSDKFQTTINPSQIEAKLNIDDIINNAYTIGRNGNIVQNNYSILFSMLFKNKLTSSASYNEYALDYIISDISKQLPGIVEESSYYIEDSNFIITRGKEGIVLNNKELKELIIQAINSIDNKTIEIPVETKQPDEIDIDKIYSEVHKEPKNATYEENPFKLYPHTDGVDFDISIDEVKNSIKEAGEEYIIPLKITVPEVTTQNIGIEIFPNLLSSYDTKYDVTNINRSNNLELASEKINGTIILPGETFSYNKVVGERTISAGYKEAPVYLSGKVVDGIGGGICQISSTLYNTVLQANLEIVERKNHQFKVSYVPLGQDATVAYGTIDFKFKNNREYPIKIVSSVSTGIVKISIYGIYEENEYQVEIITNVLQALPFETEEVSNSAKSGTVLQNGVTGYKTETYRILKLSNIEISRTLISTDTYNPMEKIISR